MALQILFQLKFQKIEKTDIIYSSVGGEYGSFFERR